MTDLDTQREQLAAAFDRSLDPLAEIASELEALDLDPFDLFIAFDLESRDVTEGTIDGYRRVFEEWTAHMTAEGRHPACPSEAHVKSYIQKQVDKGNASSTIKKKLIYLKGAYEYWQQDAAFPHPRDYDPIRSAVDSTSFEPSESKELPRIPIDELREHMTRVTRIRDRAVIALQLKLGLRSGEVRNIELPEVSIENSELARHYPDLGTHPRLADRPNAIFIPCDRSGNKSQRPRVLPLDDELRRVILRALLIRPTADAPWLFLSKQRHRRLNGGDVNKIWTEAFGETYPELTSHFGRHRFTTYWRVEQGVNRELIKYMRGDIVQAGPDQEGGAIDTYIHTYYEDIESLYRDKIFKLGL